MKTKYIVLVFILFSAFGSASRILAQETKRVAIIETRDPEEKCLYGIKLLLRGLLTDIIAASPGYEAIDRVDISSVMSEQEFQRNGLVDNNDIRRLGELTGSDFVLLTDIGYVDDTHMTLASKLIDVETGKITNSAHFLTSIEHNELEKNCKNIALKLLNLKSDGTASSPSSTPISTNQKGQDYIETALGLNIKMVYVEGGDFLMGGTSEQGSYAKEDENIRRVKLSSYYIGECEITQDQWTRVMGTSQIQMIRKYCPYYNDKPDDYFGSIGQPYPMVWVSWNDAMEFCEELSEITGKKYTLPTEAQWEYAARGGNKPDGTMFSGSNNIDEVAWYEGNSLGEVRLVKRKKPNSLGLYDMSGNVEEWCYDFYQSPYETSDTTDPKGPAFGERHVVRGGNCVTMICYDRISSRSFYRPTFKDRVIGFRVVMIP